MLNVSPFLIITAGLAILFAVSLIAAVWFSLRARKPAKSHHAQTAPAAPVPTLSPEAVHQLEQNAMRQLEQRVTSVVQEFDQSLAQTTKNLNDSFSTLITGVIEREMRAYREELARARSQATANLAKVQQAADQLAQSEQAELQSQMKQEKARLVEKLDQRLSDIVASYLIESLGQEIDLGAQTKYLLATLEKQKTQLKKDILGG